MPKRLPVALRRAKSVAITNAEAAETLRRYAATLLLEGGNRFKVRAYRRAAETLDHLAEPVAEILRRGDDLTELPHIGAGLAAIIEEIVGHGKLKRLEQATKALRPELAELASKPNLNPQVVLRVYKKLGISTLKQLRRALEAGKVAAAVGPRLEFQIRQGLSDRPRMLLWAAEKLVAPIERFLKALPGVTRVAVTGSLRRKVDTVGDLNFLVAARSGASLRQGFARFPAVSRSKRVAADEFVFELTSGTAVHLHRCRESDWGTSLVRSTGSAAHLRDLEHFIKRKGRSRSAIAKADAQRPMGTESEFYAAIGLPVIPAELREGRGEIEAAAQGKLPHLVELADIQGDLHMHTTASDGAETLEGMAAAAQERGYKYIAVTDHSQSLKLTNGLTERRLRAQMHAIDRLNAKLRNFVVLKSAEVDILEDGRLDYSQAMLKELDFTICSIHSRFALDREQQTRRIRKAMDNRYFTILGHATGRLLLRREAYDLDVDRILRHAKDVGCFLEINSNPNRLDLSDVNARAAKERGVLLAVNTDAHSVAELRFLSAGVTQARRAWLEPKDVLNCRSLPALRKAFRR